MIEYPVEVTEDLLQEITRRIKVISSYVRSWSKGGCFMNVSVEVREWIRKAESDLAAARLLAEGTQVLSDQ